MARKPQTTRPKSTVVRVDFTGVETGGGAKHIPDDDYLVTVEEVEQKDGQEYPYWSWKLKVDDGGKYDGTTLYNNTSLNPKSLWALRSWLEALGVEIPDGPVDIDFDDLKDLQLIVTTSTETYEGKKRSKITDFAAAEDEPEEKPAASTKGGAKPGKETKKKVVTYTSDEVGDMGEEELQGLIDANELDVDLSEMKTLRKKQNAVIDALEAKDLIKE